MPEFLALDAKTLLRMMGLADIIVCMALLAYGERGHRLGVLNKLILGRLLHACGAILIAYRGDIPYWISAPAANILVLVGFALEIEAVIAKRVTLLHSHLILSGTAFAGTFAYLAFGSTTALRVGISSLTISVIFLIGFYAFSQQRGKSAVDRMMMGSFLLVALTTLVRAFFGFFENLELFDVHLVQSLTMVAMFAYIVGGGFGYLLMTKEDADRALRDLANRDSLTGTLNRRAFFVAATGALQAAVGAAARPSLLMIDIDHFKSINDTHGHPVGDKVLQGFAHLVREYMRAGDLLGRVGGEEFALLLAPGADPAAMGERLRLAVQMHTIADVPGLRYSISIGCCPAAPGAELDDLLRICDEALYSAKRTGRNKVVRASSRIAA